jgi:hypothetical protein
MLVCLNSIVTILATAFVSYYNFVGYTNMKIKIAATIEPIADTQVQ